jgi:hypothetical protein
VFAPIKYPVVAQIGLVVPVQDVPLDAFGALPMRYFDDETVPLSSEQVACNVKFDAVMFCGLDSVIVTVGAVVSAPGVLLVTEVSENATISLPAVSSISSVLPV